MRKKPVFKTYEPKEAGKKPQPLKRNGWRAELPMQPGMRLQEEDQAETSKTQDRSMLWSLLGKQRSTPLALHRRIQAFESLGMVPEKRAVPLESKEGIESQARTKTQKTRYTNTTDTGRNCPAQSSMALTSNPLPAPTQMGLLPESPLPSANHKTPPLQPPNLPPPRPTPAPATVPQLSFQRAGDLEPSGINNVYIAHRLTGTFLQSPGSSSSATIKTKNNRTAPSVTIAPVNANLAHNTPLLRGTVALHSPARSRDARCGCHSSRHLRRQETQNYSYVGEESPLPRSPSLFFRLTSNGHPVPNVATGCLQNQRAMLKLGAL